MLRPNDQHIAWLYLLITALARKRKNKSDKKKHRWRLILPAYTIKVFIRKESLSIKKKKKGQKIIKKIMAYNFKFNILFLTWPKKKIAWMYASIFLKRSIWLGDLCKGKYKCGNSIRRMIQRWSRVLIPRTAAPFYPWPVIHAMKD